MLFVHEDSLDKSLKADVAFMKESNASRYFRYFSNDARVIVLTTIIKHIFESKGLYGSASGGING